VTPATGSTSPCQGRGRKGGDGGEREENVEGRRGGWEESEQEVRRRNFNFRSQKPRK